MVRSKINILNAKIEIKKNGFISAKIIKDINEINNLIPSKFNDLERLEHITD